jgi:hypothetical protein
MWRCRSSSSSHPRVDSSSYVPCVVQLSDPELWKWCARRMEGMDQSRSSRGIGLRRLAGEEAEWAELEWAEFEWAELEWAELEWKSDACPLPPGVTGWPPPRTLHSYGELFSRRGGLDPSLKMFRRPSESSTRPSPCRDGMRVGWYCSGPEEMEAESEAEAEAEAPRPAAPPLGWGRPPRE